MKSYQQSQQSVFSIITVRPSQLDVHAMLSDRESRRPCQLQLKTVHDHFLKSNIKTHKTGELAKIFLSSLNALQICNEDVLWLPSPALNFFQSDEVRVAS